jgi:hypothetical protein
VERIPQQRLRPRENINGVAVDLRNVHKPEDVAKTDFAHTSIGR